MNIYYFRRDETAVLGAIKAQLPFSKGKYQLLNSWNKIQFRTIFYHKNFQLQLYRIRTDQILLARTNNPLKGHWKRYEKAENFILGLSPIFSRWVPLTEGLSVEIFKVWWNCVEHSVYE